MSDKDRDEFRKRIIAENLKISKEILKVIDKERRIGDKEDKGEERDE